MAQIIVEPSEVDGEIEAQPSKSYTHRLLSIALLAEGKSKIANPLISFDTQATIDAVKILGGDVEKTDKEVIVQGTGGDILPKNKNLNVRNSGTTIRVMSAISSLSPEKVRLSGDESILKRPMGPLISSLSDLGAYASCEGNEGRPPIIVGDGLEGGETRIVGTISSQFISALLIASPYSKVGVDLEVEKGLKSKPYVEMTLKTLEWANADIRSTSSLMDYTIPGHQMFEPVKCSVPGDFSSASFILGSGALSSNGVKVTNLDPNDVQGDKKILELLERFGADVRIKGETVRVVGGKRLNGIDADCSDTPDLVPVLAVLGATAEGRTRLYGIEHLRYKEVDRISAISKELKKLGVGVREEKDELVISGSKELKGGGLNSYGDHRMVMALSVAGLASSGKVSISGAESIGVSYPNFVEDMKKLGAKMRYKE